ncbi:hypothetical protein HDU91_000939 [Kappamyces sp. JEL0680]|nr:hypothetical protein HDU91_000939 [Kappamyces sp. JEL0680]
MRFQFKSVLIGVKSCLVALKTIDNNARPTNQVSLTIESEILNRVFLHGLDCFEYYFVDSDKDKATVQKDDKEVIEAFSSIFTVIDPSLFQEVCAENIGYLFDRALSNPFIIQIPQFFLATPALSANFSSPLLAFLMTRFDEAGKNDSPVASNILRLFKLLFMALSMFPDQNEKVFQPHLAKLIMTSLKISAKAEVPLNYFMLLRGLFRSIGGGKFEVLYQEVIPLLQVLLESLNSLLAAAYKPQMRELFVELSLTVPVRLSVLLPHLSYLMRPLVIALHAGPELVNQSLKTLELCIDNLNHEFLEPIFAPVKEDLMAALWKHLHPLPYNQVHSHTTMRILGKFGGRNRRILRDQSPLSINLPIDEAIQLSFYMHGSNEFQNLPLGKALLCAKTILNSPSSVAHQQHKAFLFTKSCTPLFFDADYDPDMLENNVFSLLEASRKKKDTPSSASSSHDPFVKTLSISKVRKEALDDAVAKWFGNLISAAALPELEDEAWQFIEGVCRHFALLDLDESISIPPLDPAVPRLASEIFSTFYTSRLNGFLRAIVDSASDEKRPTREMAEKTILFLKTCYLDLLGSIEQVQQVGAFQILALWFSSQCYQPEWFKKTGGCIGITILTSKLGFGSDWMLNFQVEFVRSLLFILKDPSAESAHTSITNPSETLNNILRICNDGIQEDNPVYAAKFNSLLTTLTTELSHSNKNVREAVQEAIKCLADYTKKGVSEMLEPVRERLLFPIFAKPLRALPFALQIGYIDAITYGLSLRPPLVVFNDELGRLLHEALALADAEDQALSSKDNQYKNATAMNNLRVECIKLLSAVMTSAEILTPRLTNVRTRIITLFFKCLYSKSPEVIAVANIGLTDVLGQNQRLPKDMLQAGLKPILVNLSDYKKLTVAALEGLSRLLELLTNYFKVEIGKKLLDHLRQWAEPQKMEELSVRPLGEVEDIKIITAILDVFHLLPSAANVFLDDLVTIVIELENMVHRTQSSPFRAPLSRFLNRYSGEAVDYFLERIRNPLHVNLLTAILKDGSNETLVNEFLQNPEKLQNAFFPPIESEESLLVHQHGVKLITVLSTHKSDWTVTNRPILNVMISLWKARQPGLMVDQLGRNRQVIATLELMMAYSSKDPDDMDLLFDIIDGFSDTELSDILFLKQFVYQLSADSPSERKKKILKRFLERYAQNEYSIAQKTNHLRNFIVPMLMMSKKDFSLVVDKDSIQSILQHIWIPTVAGPASQGEIDALKMELLQFTTIILYEVPALLGDHRMEVIKYAWGHLKIEDMTIKQSAYVLLCRFIKEYETPAKIVTQTYVAQLRAHQIEIRPMVKQALDNIIPALPFHRGMSSTESGKIPVWVQWIKKIIIEDGHSVNQLVSIYQLLIRNANSFYECREHFMPQIVSSLARLALSGNATSETKTVSVDLTALISKWERQFLQEKNAGEMDVDGDNQLANSHQEVIITFLIRFCLSLTDQTLHKSLFSKALETLESFFVIWPGAAVSIVQLEKLAGVDITEANLAVNLNAAELLKIMVRAKPLPWVQSNLGLIQKCLEKWGSFNPNAIMVNNVPSVSENAALIESISEIISRSITALEFEDITQSPSRTLEKQTFFKLVDTKIHDNLKTGINVDMTTCFLRNAYFARVSDPSVSQSLRPHLAELAKLLQRLVEENASGEVLVGNAIENIKILVLILDSQMLYLGEIRKSYLSAVSLVLERKETAPLHRLVLDLLRRWLLESAGEGFPTLKEKANLAIKMFALKGHADAGLYEDYMNFVADVYEEGHLAKSELTVRLETVFLEGTKLSNPAIRTRFMTILDQSVPNTMQSRLKYVLAQQNWQCLADSFWINQALVLLLGSIDGAPKVFNSNSDSRYAFLHPGDVESVKTRKKNPALKSYLAKEVEFLQLLKGLSVDSLIQPLKFLVHDDHELGYDLWSQLFPLCWNSLDGIERHDTVKALIALLAKEYHVAQANVRPNVVQTLLNGICRTKPSIQLPPQLIKYLGKTYNAWHIALELLQNTIADLRLSSVGSSKDDEKYRDVFMDALADLYSDLGEDDYFAGLWRRRCLIPETNAAISFEQVGMWEMAQKFYEDAQAKARTCALPFTESEYCLWEKRWVYCTQELQQWEILTDLSKQDSNPDLLLECAWRLSDWNNDRDSLNMTLQSVSQPATARKKFFQAVLVLNRISEGQEPTSEFHKVCDEGIQLVLKQWNSLPTIVSNAHLSTFHAFQQFVELHEAFTIQSNLIGTTAVNIDIKSQELKNILSTWRDRLPNLWDDMNMWSDLVSWRQHVFTSINKAYLPLIPHISAPANGGNPTSSYAYRGYHETAWIINRFANVARKHNLPSVCITSLSKIYTLPNIEIQEAFFKLREQAKCHKDVLGEYAAGLDVINNTNLLYFNNSQKADFFTLRGTFFSKLNLHEDAVKQFSSAIQMDTNLGHAWSNFGEYNDRMFDEQPTVHSHAGDAVNCYLHAAGIFNSGRSRKYLSRVLWLLSVDDDNGTVLSAAENYKTDSPVWYWITFIPELIGSLAGKEFKFSRNILIKIAKSYPQALHFQLRTAKEDFVAMKRNAQSQNPSSVQSSSQVSGQLPSAASGQAPTPDVVVKDENGDIAMTPAETTEGQPSATDGAETPANAAAAPIIQPWDHIEEIMAILKTAYPLLALTMETMVDQMVARLKPSTDEDIYRLIVALLNDGVQMHIVQLPKNPETGGPLSQATEASLARFADSMVPNHVKYKEAFENDFISSKPNLSDLVVKFRRWRDNLENLLDSRPQRYFLEHFTQYLAEFEYSKFDDIEVPGQYFQMKNSSKDFSRIERFDPLVDIVRGHSGCHRRIVIHGHDGSKNGFIIQHPAAKQCRREERTQQLFRLLNETLDRRIESRRRNLQFHLPIIIPLAPQIRLVQDDRSNVNLQEIYEDHARKSGFSKDDPIILYTNRLREACLAQDMSKRSKAETLGLKAEINAEISEKMIPETVVSTYFSTKMASFQDLWVLRKRFTSQMAAVSFMCYLLSIGGRIPQKFYISAEKGNIWLPELLSSISSQTFLFHCNESIPFRLTPNLQHFMGPNGLEGLYAASMVTIASVLSEGDTDLRDFLSIFIRDEIISWQTAIRKPMVQSTSRLRELVNQNLRLCLSRAQNMSCKTERSLVRLAWPLTPQASERSEPVNQSILDLISTATNPLKLAHMEVSYLSQL